MRHQRIWVCTALAVTLGVTAIRSDALGGGAYSISPQTLDSGGGRATSANYTVDAGIGSIAGAVSTTSLSGMARHGYVGQLTDTVGLTLNADTTTVNEEDTRQLSALGINDDDTLTLLAGTEVTWSVDQGPIADIDTAGLATAEAVYEDTPAIVRGIRGNVENTLSLTVLNTLLDNYGTYAADGIDDDWQVGFYGIDNPSAAPGYNPFGTGDNLFKFYAGLDPTDPTAQFHIAVHNVVGEPLQKDLSFWPLAEGRVYTLQSRIDLTSGDWSVLENVSLPLIEGDQATVTDLEALDTVRFYRVQIAWPR